MMKGQAMCGCFTLTEFTGIPERMGVSCISREIIFEVKLCVKSVFSPTVY